MRTIMRPLLVARPLRSRQIMRRCARWSVGYRPAVEWRAPAARLPARIMRLLALGAALSAATPAVSHAAPCSRPLAPPGPIAAPRDEDYRAMAQLELETYLNEVADYLNCLKRESDEAAREARELAERWYAADPLTWR